MLNIVGTVKLRAAPKATTYFWGPISEIAGHTLKVFERNAQGDCLCLTDKGLVHVDAKDVEIWISLT